MHIIMIRETERERERARAREREGCLSEKPNICFLRQSCTRERAHAPRPHTLADCTPSAVCAECNRRRWQTLQPQRHLWPEGRGGGSEAAIEGHV